MKFIKKNKSILIILGIIIVILLITFLALYKLLFNGYTGTKYGNRLDGIENVLISDEIITSAKEVFSSVEGVSDVSYNLSGKICNFIVIVSKDVKESKLKETASKILEKFDDKQLEFYDFQVFFDTKEESNKFPIIGYKINTEDKFSWTGKVVKDEK